MALVLDEWEATVEVLRAAARCELDDTHAMVADANVTEERCRSEMDSLARRHAWLVVRCKKMVPRIERAALVAQRRLRMAAWTPRTPYRARARVRVFLLSCAPRAKRTGRARRPVRRGPTGRRLAVSGASDGDGRWRRRRSW